MTGDVDPRFDPRFQRGYDPARHAVREQPASRRAEGTAPQGVPPLPTVEPAESAESTKAEPFDEDPFGEDPLGENDDPPRRSAPVLALLIGGAGLVVAAIGMLLHAVLDPNQPYTMSPHSWAPVWMMLRNVLPQPMLVGGLAAIATGFAVRAVLRERR